MRVIVAAVVLLAAIVEPLRVNADEASPQELVRPSPIPPTITTSPVAVPGAPRRAGDSADAGALKGARNLEVRGDEARVTLADGSLRTLRVGDVVGDDTLERIESGRLIFQRRASPGGLGGGLVIVTFGPDGRAHVRVYRNVSSTAPAPEVR